MIRRSIAQYLLPCVGFAGIAGTTITGLWLSLWLANQPVIAAASGASELSDDLWQLVHKNILETGTPVPWFTAAILANLVGVLDSVWNRARLNQNQLLTTEVEDLKDRLRRETEEHGASKLSYHESLTDALSFLLTRSATGFDDSCRVTVYRRQQTADNTLKRIFRYSRHNAYAEGGRIRVPLGEGIVGMAWSTNGEEEFSCPHPPTHSDHQESLGKKLSPHSIAVPNSDLSMPSQHIVARAVDDIDSGKRIAIVVYESVSERQLDSGGIRDLLTNQGLQTARLIRRLGVLDEEVKPDPKG